MPAEGRHPLPRQRDRHPAVGHAVHDVRRRGPRSAREEGTRLHRQRAGRRAPGRLRGEPFAHADLARAAAARGRRRIRSRSTRWSIRPSPPLAMTGSGATGSSRPTSSSGMSSRRSGGCRAPVRCPPGCGRGSAAACCSTRCSSSACSPASGAPWSRPAAPSSRSTPASRRLSPASPGPWSTATEGQDTLDGDLASLPDERLVAWTRGVLEHMRVQGAIEHEWFQSYIRHDGNRYHIWGGRPRGQGMPAFPRGRSAPALPEDRPVRPGQGPAARSRSAPPGPGMPGGPRGRSASPPAHGARLARQLLERLARAEVLHTVVDRGRRHRVHHPGELGRGQPGLA